MSLTSNNKQFSPQRHRENEYRREIIIKFYVLKHLLCVTPQLLASAVKIKPVSY
jgi:hypothetical protein